ncbi:dihydrofolate reductase [archaeon]|nr:dihydrofolate reductase [archaeon]MBT4647114.1 dihydrofolate reductase [archaeon]MBT6821104.1 dihydrofolate reductase [archaeon]MBT7392186.1 dihydrofolate reductase [archaeon]
MSKKIILYVAMSLDGFIAKKNGSVDFLDKYNESGEDFGYYEFLDSISSVIIGNSTYKQFGAPYKNKKIFIFSRKKHENKKDIIFVNGDIKEFAKKLKNDTWMVGGASIFNEFLKYDLIDEFIITIIPVLLGEGILLFTKSSIKNLKLIDTKSYDCGVVQVHYKKI